MSTCVAVAQGWCFFLTGDVSSLNPIGLPLVALLLQR